MAKVKDISWGSYDTLEGPFYLGKHAYLIPSAPTWREEALLLLAATEGGHYDDYNGYDKCICTSGLSQWCDRAPMFLVCALLGSVAAANSALLAPVVELASEYGYTFGQTAKNEWRFWNEQGDVVDDPAKQRELYFGGASGLKGDWNDSQKLRARRWAAAISSVWEQPEAQVIQQGHTCRKLLGFAMPSARPVLDKALEVNNKYSRAFLSAYISFAANNPARAATALAAAVSELGLAWTEGWLIGVLHHLTFDSGIAIYPHRYDKIRPVLEDLYGVDLPDFSGSLRTWQQKVGLGGALDPKELQRALRVLGYDLGPKGADGVFGGCTRHALRKFEQDALVPEPYCDGYPDRYTVGSLEKALALVGDKLRWRESS